MVLHIENITRNQGRIQEFFRRSSNLSDYPSSDLAATNEKISFNFWCDSIDFIDIFVLSFMHERSLVCQNSAQTHFRATVRNMKTKIPQNVTNSHHQINIFLSGILEDKFAVGSGARLISVCYFEQENDW